MTFLGLSVYDIILLPIQGVLAFVISTFAFDSLHWALHQWKKSRIPLLRKLSRWHFIHHKFLDRRLRINQDWVAPNFWYHLIPEFATTLAGTAICYLFFHWLPVTAVLLLHVRNFANEVRHKGMAENHMAMKRVSGKRGTFFVNPIYHAQHHIFLNAAFSSYFNVFDMVFGTAMRFDKRRFLVTGATGAFGAALVERLRAMGATVETAAHGIDYAVGDYDRLLPKLARAEVLVLAHGAKIGKDACMNANCVTFTDIIERFREVGSRRLNVPEVWALGSEAELHGDLGEAGLVDYVASKRAFALAARRYYADSDLYYRHIVPSAFTSAMGKGPMSARTAAGIALFFIRRGFRYVPVTLTTLAFWNYFRFVRLPIAQTT